MLVVFVTVQLNPRGLLDTKEFGDDIQLVKNAIASPIALLERSWLVREVLRRL